MSTVRKVNGQTFTDPAMSRKLRIRGDLKSLYPDVYTPEVMTALAYMAKFNEEQKTVMVKRIQRRAERARNKG